MAKGALHGVGAEPGTVISQQRSMRILSGDVPTALQALLAA